MPRTIRTLIAQSLVAGLAAGAFGAEPAEPPVVASRIDAVTVYLDRAYVSRVAEVDLGADRTTVCIDGLPAELDDASVRCRVAGGELVALQVEREFLTRHPEAEIRSLEERLREHQERRAALEDELAALEAADGFLAQMAATRATLDRVEAADGRLAVPAVADYAAVLDFLTERRLANAGRRRAITAEAAALEPAAEALRRELDEKRSDARLETKRVLVTVAAGDAGRATLTLSYLLPGALWFPAYDLRADLDAGTVEVVYDAVVQQATGEDWPAAVVTLSAARPAVAVQPPAVRPFTLDARTAPRASRGPAQTAATGGSWNLTSLGSGYHPGDNLKLQLKMRGGKLRKAHEALLGNAVQAELVARSVEERGTSVVFAVADRRPIPADGKPYRVSIQRQGLDMSVHRYAVPAQSLNAYRRGRVRNDGELPYLPGRANVFLDSDLIGSAELPFVAPGEETDLYLGIDDQIKITRRLDRRNSSTSSFSDTHRLDLLWRTTVENLHEAAVAVTVHEALPVSQDERIRVRIRDLEPHARPDDRGLVAYPLELAPGQTVPMTARYTVDYPMDIVVHSLGGAGHDATLDAEGVMLLERYRRSL